MISFILAAYAICAAALAPRVLARARWAQRAPRLAIALWQAASVSVVASALLAALAYAIPAEALGHGLVGLFEACAALLADSDTKLKVSSTGARLALLATGLLLGRVAYSGVAVLLRARGQRRRHAEILKMLGRRDGELDALVVQFDEPMAYCMPGRGGQTVITTGALRALSPEQVAAVLAHERAHLKGRHHLVLAGAEALARAFPGVPLFAQARAEIAPLVELLADDVAARRHSRFLVASALVGLATARVPGFALGAGGETALTRLRRMLGPAVPLTRRERFAGVIAVAFLLAGPAAVALLPGASDFLGHHCHLRAIL